MGSDKRLEARLNEVERLLREYVGHHDCKGRPELGVFRYGKCPLCGQAELVLNSHREHEPDCAIYHGGTECDQGCPEPAAPYDPKFGDGRKCVCGDPYFRHFDPAEDWAPVGCKYSGSCGCTGFEEAPKTHEIVHYGESGEEACGSREGRISETKDWSEINCLACRRIMKGPKKK